MLAEKSAVMHKFIMGFLYHAKIKKLMIHFHKERMDRCKNERKDGQIIFFRTLLATASGLKTFLIITGRSYVLGCYIVVFVLG